MGFEIRLPNGLPEWVGKVEAGPVGEGGTALFSIRNPIDRFVLEKLQEAKIEPSPACTDEEFVRRAYLDVVGMIPTVQVVKDFVADRSPLKREKLADALLKNERYGQHWAVMWGDLLREHAGDRKEGTLRGSYHAWLREALESNMPCDRFAMELMTATGRPDEDGAVNFFLRDENNRIETVNTVASVFMGSRMACAQCHDHPFDTWEQKDFHSLLAFFSPRTAVQPDQNATLAALREARGIPADILEKALPYIAQAEANLKAEAAQKGTAAAKSGGSGGGMMGEMGGMGGMSGMNGMSGNGAGMDSKGETKKADPKAAKPAGKEEKVRPTPPRDLIRALHKDVESLGKQKVERLQQILQGAQVRKVLERPVGEYRMPEEGDGQDKKNKNAGEQVDPVFPWDKALKASANSRRTDLARFVVQSHRFAEVQANRLWSRLMGRGVVEPVDDFRAKNPPTHPELLDYLADELIKAKFDSKHVLRLILTSSAYERSSAPTAGNREDKELYSHQRLRRMTAEQIFDSILVATGRQEGLKDLAGGKKGLASMDASRRGAKAKDLQWASDLPTPARSGTFLNTFNQPDREQLCCYRDQNGSITQALELLNGKSINDAVALKDGHLTKLLVDTEMPGEIIARELYLATLSRYPTAKELAVAKLVLRGSPPPAQAVEDFHWALLNSREFTFIK